MYFVINDCSILYQMCEWRENKKFVRIIWFEQKGWGSQGAISLDAYELPKRWYRAIVGRLDVFDETEYREYA